MHWTSVFVFISLIGIGSNLDNTGVGIAYGVAGIRFPHRVNLVINVVGFGFALLGGYAGESIGRYITPTDSQLLAGLILCAIGVYTLYSSVLKGYVDKDLNDGTPVPDIRTGFVLGVALSFTNIASSLGATISGVAPDWLVALSIGIWGYLLIWFGAVAGRHFVARFLGKYASLMSGILLIGVGLHQMV